MRNLSGMQDYFNIPFEEVQKNLRKILEEHGVSKENCEDWPQWSDFYFELLDENGELSKRGADLLLYFKDYIGDHKKESYVEMFVID